jgi:gas vesicle protein
MFGFLTQITGRISKAAIAMVTAMALVAAGVPAPAWAELQEQSDKTPGGILDGSGSSSAENEKELTPAEKELRSESGEFAETVAGGAIFGAILGAMAMAALGALGNPGNAGAGAAQGAIMGAAIGGIMGGVDGYLTAKQRQNANNNIRMTNAMAEDVRKDNERLERLVKSSNEVLVDSRTQLEDIKSQVEQNQKTVAQADAERQRYEKNRDAMQTALSDLQKRRDNYAQAATKMRSRGARTADLDRQIESLNKQIEQLEKNVSDMNNALAVTKVS